MTARLRCTGSFRVDLRLDQNTRKEIGLRHCPTLLSPGDVARTFGDLVRLEREVLICAALDTRCRLVYWNLLAVGSSDRVTMRLGDAFAGAIRQSARSIILIHNHPSGSLHVSKEDVSLTRRVAEAGELLGYALLDHVILSRYGYRSVMGNRRKASWETATAPLQEMRLHAADRLRGRRLAQTTS